MTSPNPYADGYQAGLAEAERIVKPWLRADHVRLHVGEMTAQEMRSVLAVVGAIDRAIAERRRNHEAASTCKENLQVERAGASSEVPGDGEKDARIAELEAKVAKVTEQRDRLAKAIRAYMSGDYDSPRSNRPNNCKHGLPYYETCEACVDAHFQAAPDTIQSTDREGGRYG